VRHSDLQRYCWAGGEATDLKAISKKMKISDWLNNRKAPRAIETSRRSRSARFLQWSLHNQIFKQILEAVPALATEQMRQSIDYAYNKAKSRVPGRCRHTPFGSSRA